MSKIKVTLPGNEIPVDGKQVSFAAPCNSSTADCIQIDGEDYTVVDAMGKTITGKRGVWDTGAIVSVVLNVTNKKAYMQNPAKSIPVSIETTLLAADWVGSSIPYTQDVFSSSISADSQGVVTVSESATDAQFQEAAASTLRKTAQSDGRITIKAYGNKPTVDIPITIILN